MMTTIIGIINFILIAIFCVIVIVDKKHEMKVKQHEDEQMDKLIRKLDGLSEMVKYMSEKYYNPYE